MEKVYIVYEQQEFKDDSILFATNDKKKANVLAEIDEDCYAYVEEYQSTNSFTNQKDVTELETKIKELEKEVKRLTLFCMKQYGKTE